jgi:hypothetical protein
MNPMATIRQTAAGAAATRQDEGNQRVRYHPDGCGRPGDVARLAEDQKRISGRDGDDGRDQAKPAQVRPPGQTADEISDPDEQDPERVQQLGDHDRDQKHGNALSRPNRQGWRGEW